MDAAFFGEHKGDLEALRRNAVTIGQGKKFLIDISRFEYTDGKQEADLDGYRIYVYSPTMIVCEKLRALCQQMDEYMPIIRRSRPGSHRARDVIDIYTLMETLKLNVCSGEAIDMLVEMFRLKRVPTEWLGLLQNYREFHRQDFPAVVATVSPDVELESFDFYFDYVVRIAVSVSDRLAAKG